MKHKSLFSAVIIVMMFVYPLFSAQVEDIQTKKLTEGRLAYYPVPRDNINYIFLQSIEKDTVIVIGDFSAVDKKIVMIVDKNSDNTIDSVFEYFPATKDLKRKTESKSRFFTKDIAKLKKEIIDGTAYKGNYTDDMKSYKTLESILNNYDTNSLNADVYGFNIRLYETDERKKHSALFSYGKGAGGYYLQFRTEFYRRDKNTVQEPALKYSVYCRDSNDPVVRDTVENLFSIKQPIVNFDKTESKQKSK